MHYLLVDQLYAKKVYFCSFVTKSNQTSTKYSPDAFSSFYRTMGFSQPPSLLIQGFPTFHYKIFSFCRLSIFFIKKLQAPSKRYTILQKVFTSLFTCQFSASKKKMPFWSFIPPLFLLYINDLPDDVICDIAIYADDATLDSKCDQALDLWKELQLASETEPDLQDTVNWLRKWLVDFKAGENQLVLFDRSNHTDAVDVKIDGFILEEKSSFKMLR